MNFSFTGQKDEREIERRRGEIENERMSAAETGAAHTLPTSESAILQKAQLVKELVNDLEFQRYLKSQFATESLDFYKDASAFETSAATMPETERKTEAERIVKKFIDLGSPFQINVDSAVRLATKEKVKNGAEPGTFAVPIDAVVTLLADRKSVV